MSARNTAVFGLYPDEAELAEGIEELTHKGFRTTDFSILLPENLGSKDIGHEKHSKAPEGAVAGGVAGLIAGGVVAYLMQTGLITFQSPVVDVMTTAHPVLAVLAGAGAFGFLFALIGALLGSFQPEYEAKRYEGRIRSGGVLLSVHCDNADWRNRAKETLRDTGAKGIASARESRAEFGASEKPKSRIRSHELPRRRTFLRGGEPVDVVDRHTTVGSL